jgi:hypothetical protein
MGYKSGRIHTFDLSPDGKTAIGKIKGDNGTIFSFKLPVNKRLTASTGRYKNKWSVGARVLFVPGGKTVAHDIKLSLSKNAGR